MSSHCTHIACLALNSLLFVSWNSLLSISVPLPLTLPMPRLLKAEGDCGRLPPAELPVLATDRALATALWDRTIAALAAHAQPITPLDLAR